jgi:indole-3-glycerol phosphate synthase
MKTHLDRILIQKREEVKQLKTNFTIKDFEQFPSYNTGVRSLKSSLITKSFGVIAELKRKSPSANTIQANLPLLPYAKMYEKSGAAAISVLTDFTFFGGSNDDLSLVKEHVNIPVLRKEFIVDEIQLFESKAIGADAILLIAEALTKEEILHFTIIAQSIGLEVLFEFHGKDQLAKGNEMIDVLGVNNRNLQLQKTDIQTSIDLFDYLPKGQILISESGIKTLEDVQLIADKGYQGALIGESILKHENPSEFLKSLTMNSSLSC